MKTKLTYEKARAIALPIIEVLRSHCARIEIAGSLRRRQSKIGDIEIVATPRKWEIDLFGVPTETHNLDTFNWNVWDGWKKEDTSTKKLYCRMRCKLSWMKNQPVHSTGNESPPLG